MPEDAEIQKVLGSSSEEFRRILDIVRSDIASKTIRITASPLGAISLKVDQSSFQDQLKNLGLTFETGDQVLREITAMINAILGNDEGAYLFFRMRDKSDWREKGPEGLLKVAEDELKNRIESVRASLTDKMKNKYLLRITSKEAALSRLEWEARSKHYDGKRGEINIPPYICLNIEYFKMRPERGLMQEELGRLLGGGDTSLRQSIAFELDADDIDDIIQTLETAKRHLKDFKGAEQ